MRIAIVLAMSMLMVTTTALVQEKSDARVAFEKRLDAAKQKRNQPRVNPEVDWVEILTLGMPANDRPKRESFSDVEWEAEQVKARDEVYRQHRRRASSVAEELMIAKTIRTVRRRMRTREARQALQRRIKTEAENKFKARLANPNEVANQILNGADPSKFRVAGVEKVVAGYEAFKTQGKMTPDHHRDAFIAIDNVYAALPPIDIATAMFCVTDDHSYKFQTLYELLDADEEQRAVISSIVEASNSVGEDKNKYANQLRRCLTAEQIAKSKTGEIQQILEFFRQTKE
ncbi:MAG: hypothetical protein AB8B55_07810 [Mariniblastus sp.]